MKATLRATGLSFVVTVLLVGAFHGRVACAQTPQQMQYEQQRREYWRAQEQQRQEQQRQQQIMNENARRQQESADAARRSQEQSRARDQEFNQKMQDSQRRTQDAVQQSAPQAAQLEQARQTWLIRPSLAADRNPLLGKWTRPSSGRGNSSDPIAQLGALMKGGMCKVLFGGGVFEFRADRLVGSDQRTGEQELDRVEYRGDTRQVVVLPKTTLKLIVFDFDGPNRINWAGHDCVLVRVGAASTAANMTAPGGSATGAATAGAAASAAALSLAAGITASSGQFSPPNNQNVFVLKDSAETVLARGGIQARPGMSSMKVWAAACQANSPACVQGSKAMDASRAGAITTDTLGKAQLPSVPAGTYCLVAFSRADNHPLMWNVRVEVKPGPNAVTLDQLNANAFR